MREELHTECSADQVKALKLLNQSLQRQVEEKHALRAATLFLVGYTSTGGTFTKADDQYLVPTEWLDRLLKNANQLKELLERTK